MARYLLTARLSQLQSDGRPGLGLETQDMGARAWAEREGHTIVDIAADTKSGTVAPMDRNNLRRWIVDDTLRAQYDGLLAFKTDRLSRGTQEDFTRIEAWATEHGKSLVIADGPQYPARNDADYWQWTAEKRSARVEWENDRERSMRAQRELRQRGKLVGRPPFGYQVTGVKYDKTLEPSELGLIIVPAIFRWVSAGLSLERIAERLTALGVPTMNRKAVNWSPNRISAIIKCPTYKGRRCAQHPKTKKYGKLLHTCPELIDAGTWKAANDALDKRPGRGRRGGTVHPTAMLSGVLQCPSCFAPAYRVFCGPVGKRVGYYRCAGKLSGTRQASCEGAMVPCATADRLAETFLAALESPVLREVTTPATDYADKLEKVADELADLPRLGLDEDKEDAERARLRAERKRLAALPSEPSKTVLAVTDETYGQVWRALEPSARNDWLRSSGITFSAAKTSSGLAEQWIAGLPWPYSEASRLLPADGVSVVVSWLMSGLDDAENIGADPE